ncbi:MAG: GAF domain-containing protein [Candidatus Dormibacteraeota bacterium]|nr:GAF domain-containing protein [Candidatus Dormibacteraeota bacterium]
MDDVRRVLDAVVAVSADLDLEAVLHRIVKAARELAGARYAALGVLLTGPGGEVQLAEFVSEGFDEETVRRIGLCPHGRGILGVLISHPAPLRLHDLAKHPNSYGFPEGHPAMHTFLGVPIRVRDQVFGNLYLTEKAGDRDFSPRDEELVVGLASAAAVAIENARLHEKVRDLAVLQDRERIARDLHDTVIQRLFATGMSLQGLARRAGDVEVGDRIQSAVEDLDDTIRDIRGVIFALQAHGRGERSVRIAVLALAAEAALTLGFEPRVHFDGPVDTVIGADLGEHLLAVLRELLSNVTKHAQASVVDVYVRVGVDVTLSVVDNGLGFNGEREGGQGLKNLRQRARALGGDFSIRPAEERGTLAVLRVPRESGAGAR